MTRIEVNEQFYGTPVPCESRWLKVIVVVVVLIMVTPIAFSTSMRKQLAVNTSKIPARALVNIQKESLMNVPKRVADGNIMRVASNNILPHSSRENIRSLALKIIQRFAADNIK